ncbi:hypothetical protein CSHISOI_05413 [Colletotrichum shisoi]|uniref:Uncharacterized protein n=1 Tax=Colletotrichum shisoi TaxID=2078593 RepID=A0A5Q4BTY6_9PEZI|nr:hypothetical protein CSHISOI_05413 [Colletotrichum shisoi]
MLLSTLPSGRSTPVFLVELIADLDSDWQELSLSRPWRRRGCFCWVFHRKLTSYRQIPSVK